MVVSLNLKRKSLDNSPITDHFELSFMLLKLLVKFNMLT